MQQTYTVARRRACRLACGAWASAALLCGCAAVAPHPEAAAPAAPASGPDSAATSVAAAASAPAAPASAASAASPPRAAASAAAPAGPPPLATVVKEATKLTGLFTLYQKDEKVWIELKPSDFDKPLFLSPKLATGIGEAGLFGGLMNTAMPVEFRRVHNLVQLIQLNTGYYATPGTPEGRAVAAAYSPSLLASTAVASQPDPDGKGVLVDASALFSIDMLGLGIHLQRTFRQNYGFDARNSAITTLRDRPDAVVLQVLEHFASASIAVPQPGSPPGAAAPSVPDTVPDPRSLFLTVHYTLSALPDQPMRPRLADPRIGYFTTRRWDFSDDLPRTPVLHYAEHWRLEKKDPEAALSEPVQPIVYRLDPTIPLKYRDTITAGILEWNKAFERIGFKDAIQVRAPTGEADVDTLDSGASVRWMTNAQPTFGAIGPSHVDPRTGEILAANIAIEGLSSRNIRTYRTRILNDAAGEFSEMMQFGGPDSARAPDERQCLNAQLGAEQLGYGLDVLQARGDIDPDSPEAQAFVLAYLKDVAMHEVGHTLGLRHNFRASRVYSDAQLSDPEFTASHALTGSVMEYAPINLAAPGQRQVTPFQSTLGPYDYWAIEYAYKPIDPQQEKAELNRIASRSAEPELAFGTDEDNFLGIDPDSLQMDLGSDPLTFTRKRLAIARDLFQRQEVRQMPADQDYAVLRRSLNYAINDAARAVGTLARQIGGVRTLRDYPGSGRDPLQPVPAATQREALDVLSSGLLSADSFRVSPALQRRLAPDFQERSDALARGDSSVTTDYPLTDRVLGMQRALLTQLMGDPVAARVLDSQGKAEQGDRFELSELYARLQRDVWGELDAIHAGRSVDIAAPRRALQQDHLGRLAALLVRPASGHPPELHSLVRAQAQALLVRLNAAVSRPGLGPDVRAHLADSAETLSQALSAKLVRAGL